MGIMGNNMEAAISGFWIYLGFRDLKPQTGCVRSVHWAGYRSRSHASP